MDFHSVEADISLVLNDVVQSEIPKVELPTSGQTPLPTIPRKVDMPSSGETPPIIPPKYDNLPMEQISIKLQSSDEINELADTLLNLAAEQLKFSTSKRSNTGKALPTLQKMFVEEISKFEAQNIKDALNRPVEPIEIKPQIRNELVVGVTPPELEKASPAAVGRIRLQMGVQNYEWIEVDRDESGRSIQKLTPTGR
ncbi:hypothetical protein F7731_22390 [Cytobacillus depressus]|uniref:Uncharacterized protein n=2 Tax=Cytobacillus depressus TaxID=1602942 RepID=A0A6L3V146_9BACI|nr:hypothetical protein F7731_22390 [Cytobacillus depressus]